MIDDLKYQIKNDLYEIELEFSNGEIITLSDETGGEGIEYEIFENDKKIK